jgi:hypothetical protein
MGRMLYSYKDEAVFMSSGSGYDFKVAVVGGDIRITISKEVKDSHWMVLVSGS